MGALEAQGVQGHRRATVYQLQEKPAHGRVEQEARGEGREERKILARKPEKEGKVIGASDLSHGVVDQKIAKDGSFGESSSLALFCF